MIEADVSSQSRCVRVLSRIGEGITSNVYLVEHARTVPAAYNKHAASHNFDETFSQ